MDAAVVSFMRMAFRAVQSPSRMTASRSATIGEFDYHGGGPMGGQIGAKTKT
jgi:hypothetical protein